MNGIDDQLFAQHPPAWRSEVLSNRPGSEEIRLIFRRPSGDLTSPIGSYQFRTWSKRFHRDRHRR
jgi:hypothetical protein